MITTNNPIKCSIFDIIPTNTELICDKYKSKYESTTIKRDGCWNCIYYR